jgi:hypothetical protein
MSAVTTPNSGDDADHAPSPHSRRLNMGLTCTPCQTSPQIAAKLPIIDEKGIAASPRGRSREPWSKRLHPARKPRRLEAAAALLGAKGFTTDPETIAPWLTDWRQRFTGRALGMASPASTEEVAGLVRLCAAHNVPIVPQGGNSGMSGGATPDETGHAVVLSLRRMNAIRVVDTATRSATCEAG